jgi:hypothetical protein
VPPNLGSTRGAIPAVAVLERLHDNDLLFPSRLESRRRPENARRTGGFRTGQLVAADLAEFTAWCNTEAGRLGAGQIPADRNGPLNASRFRRTLAWFIRRRPRGLVAGSIQYGHVHTRLIQGYAGDYDSGFPDEYAFEDALARMDELTTDLEALSGGEHVSGPAASAYRERLTAAGSQFAGRVLTSSRQARDLLANPLLKIFHGDGMTCVFDPQQAACQLRGTADDPTVTPTLTTAVRAARTSPAPTGTSPSSAPGTASWLRSSPTRWPRRSGTSATRPNWSDSKRSCAPTTPREKDYDLIRGQRDRPGPQEDPRGGGTASRRHATAIDRTPERVPAGHRSRHRALAPDPPAHRSQGDVPG